jgi:hypothetical protein
MPLTSEIFPGVSNSAATTFLQTQYRQLRFLRSQLNKTATEEKQLVETDILRAWQAVYDAEVH